MNIRDFSIILILIVFILIFIISKQNNVSYVKSDIDNNTYLVRDVKDKQQAANLLARIKNNIDKLVYYLKTSKENNDYKNFIPYINQLDKNIRFVVISENTPDSMYTSYSVNKGEEIVFCIRSNDIDENLHSLNLMMYVTIHELAHVACPETGHTKLFKKIFSFLIKNAIKIKIYKKINFETNNVSYCGMILSNHI